jgi:NAD+ synthase
LILVEVMIDYDLDIDPLKTKNIIIPFIRESIAKKEASGLVIIFSGQNDSYTTSKLCIEAVGSERVALIILSDIKIDRRNEIMSEATRVLDIPSERIYSFDIRKIMKQFDEIEGILPDIMKRFPIDRQHNIGSLLLQTQIIQKMVEEKTFTAVGSTKDEREEFLRKVIAYSKVRKRLKTLLAYLIAERENLLLVSKTNKTEFLTGLFTSFGYGHGGDIAPLGDLYRTQVLQMADYLEVPQEIRRLAYSDIMPDVINKYQYFFKLESSDVDKILIRLQAGLYPNQIAKVLDIDVELIKRVHHFFEIAQFQQKVPHIIRISNK